MGASVKDRRNGPKPEIVHTKTLETEYFTAIVGVKDQRVTGAPEIAREGGRPQEDYSQAGLQQLARAHAPLAIVTLVRCLKARKAGWTAKTRAAEILLDRAFGKPHQTLSVSPGEMSDGDLTKRAREIMQARMQAESGEIPEALAQATKLLGRKPDKDPGGTPTGKGEDPTPR